MAEPDMHADDRPMSGRQIVAVACAVLLNALDGFDVLAITFALPGIARAWSVGPAELGVALSSGLVGNAYHHSDLGGYTSLYDNVRTAELLMRWSELSAFSPVMRSHEGNRPDTNLQLDGDAAVLAHFVRMTKVHAALAPYVAGLCEEAAATGLPLQRAMFLDYEDDAASWGVETQFAYGRDLIVAPVIEAGAERWSAYLPAGAEWRHLWSGETFTGGTTIEVAAPVGEPPVFWRVDSAYAALFASIATL